MINQNHEISSEENMSSDNLTINSLMHSKLFEKENIVINYSSDHKTRDISFPDGLVFCTLCTENYLTQAYICASSFQKYHPEARILLMVVDGSVRPERIPEDWIVVFPREIGVPNFGWLASKYGATDLCCAMKPFLISEAFHLGDKIIYADSDIETFSRFEEMLDMLSNAPFVVTPHMLAPFPRPERPWERPTIGDIAYSGVMNAGLFGANSNQGASKFIKTWSNLVTQPGAFFNELGPQMEQNSFNWITAFEPRTLVLGDPRYNVSYWNIDDRSLRWAALDGGSREEWTVNGRQLAAFHYSGVRINDLTRISLHDYRHSIITFPSIYSLYKRYFTIYNEINNYINQKPFYALDYLPNGLKLNDDIRYILKKYERHLPIGLDPWTEDGSVDFCKMLMSPVPATGTLLPFIFAQIYKRREDLQRTWPTATIAPEILQGWIANHGVREHNLEILYDTGRAIIAPKAEYRLFSNILNRLGKDNLDLYKDRFEISELFQEIGDIENARNISEARLEIYSPTPVAGIINVYKKRNDLQNAFPDPLGADFDKFVEWINNRGYEEYYLPHNVHLEFKKYKEEVFLARIMSYLNRRFDLVDKYPRALIGDKFKELMSELLPLADEGVEFGVDDLILANWLLELHPSRGLKYMLELLPHRTKLSTRERQVAFDMCSPILSKEIFDKAFENYIENFDAVSLSIEKYARQRNDNKKHRIIRTFADVAISVSDKNKESEKLNRYYEADRILTMQNHKYREINIPKTSSGINLFGYFCSNIGVGLSSHGLASSFKDADIPHASHVLTSSNMGSLHSWRQLAIDYRHDFDTNVFVSYPHYQNYIKGEFPVHYFEGKRNIMHLAWEQRDWNEFWLEMYDFVDEFWAISEFAALPLRKIFGERVKIVPNVLLTDKFPDPVFKEEVGLNQDEINFLYIFDANSSIERKNPEAVVHAFGKAFGCNSHRAPVRLILKIGHFYRAEHRQRLDRLIKLIQSYNINCKILVNEMSYSDVLRLISAVDYYVSLHRAEGFGYTCAEAMAYGVPVIATGYSGNLQFMDDQCSFLVRTDEIGVDEGDGPFQRGSVWGDPSIDHAAEIMLDVVKNVDDAKSVGLKGRERVLNQLSPKSVGQIISNIQKGWT